MKVVKISNKPDNNQKTTPFPSENCPKGETVPDDNEEIQHVVNEPTTHQHTEIIRKIELQRRGQPHLHTPINFIT